jgi:flagellar protein FliS
MNNHPASSYQQDSARGASPVGMVIALYDTILRDLRRAQAAFAAGNVETRVSELNHALTVIAHLQSVLDRQRGAEAAQRFDRFYQITHALILDANVRPTPESFLNLINMYGSLRHAWQEAEGKLPDRLPEPPAVSTTAATTVQRPNNSSDSPEPPRSNWSA